MWTLFKSRPLTAGGWLLTADRESHLKTPLQPFTVQSSPQIRCYNKNGKTAEDAGRNDFWQVLMYRGWFYEMVEERAAVDGTCSIAAGDLQAQSPSGAQNPLLYDRQAAPLEMTMRRGAYCH